MKTPTSADERDRMVHVSNAVFVSSVGVAAVGLLIAFGLVMSACADAFSGIVSGFEFPSDLDFSPYRDVHPIPIPATACPYLRLVSAAAADAGKPWHDAFTASVKWERFRSDLSVPLASLDFALGNAIPHVPALVAQDLREVQHDVQVGRVQLFAAISVNDYMSRANVIGGYSTLGHASALVGNACGAPIAPPLPF